MDALRQYSLIHYLSDQCPRNTVTRNNTECYEVPTSDSKIYANLMQHKPQSILEKSFLEWLKKAMIGEVTDVFYVPIYLAARKYGVTIVTQADFRPVADLPPYIWGRDVHKYGYKIGNYRQFVLWVAYIVNEMMEVYKKTFCEAVAAVCGLCENDKMELHIRRIMYVDSNDESKILITGVDRWGKTTNIFDRMIVSSEWTVHASPFLIIPKL